MQIAHSLAPKLLSNIQNNEIYEAHLYKNSTNSVKGDIDFNQLGEMGVIPSEILANIFNYLSPLALESCVQLNKNWSRLTIQMAENLEFTTFKKITTIILKFLDGLNYSKEQIDINASMHKICSPNPTSLILIKEALRKKIDCLLHNLQELNSSDYELSIPYFENIQDFLCFGNFREILDVYREFKLYPSRKYRAEKWIESLIKNKYIYRVPKIVITTHPSYNCEDQNFLRLTVLKLFDKGYTIQAEKILKQISDKYTYEIVDCLVKRELIDYAIFTCTVVKNSESFGIIAKYFINKGRINKIFTLLKKIFPNKQSEIPLLNVLRQLISSGYAKEAIEELKKISDNDFKKYIIEYYIVQALLKKGFIDETVELLENVYPYLENIVSCNTSLSIYLVLCKKASSELMESSCFFSILNRICDKASSLKEMEGIITMAHEIKKISLRNIIYYNIAIKLLDFGDLHKSISIAECILEKDRFYESTDEICDSYGIKERDKIYVRIVEQLIEEDVGEAIIVSQKIFGIFEQMLVNRKIWKKLIFLEDYERAFEYSKKNPKNSYYSFIDEV